MQYLTNNTNFFQDFFKIKDIDWLKENDEYRTQYLLVIKQFIQIIPTVLNVVECTRHFVYAKEECDFIFLV